MATSKTDAEIIDFPKEASKKELPQPNESGVKLSISTVTRASRRS